MSAPEQPTSAGRAGCPRPEEGQPMNAPEVWWSPSLAEDLSQGGLIERTGTDLWHQENGLWHRLDELPADAVRLVPATLNSELKVGAVPDTGQAREQILQRDITFGEYVIAVCDAIGLPHDSPRAAVVEAIRAAVAGAEALESPTDSTPKAGRGGSSEAETATGTDRTPDVAALLRKLDTIDAGNQTFIPGGKLPAVITTAEVRALLGAATTPKAGDG